MFTLNKDPDKKELRKFSRTMLIGFGLLGGVFWLLPLVKGEGSAALAWSGTGRQIAALCLWGSGVILCAATAGPRTLAKPIYIVWMSVTMAVGLVMSTVLLMLLYFVLLPAFSVVVRLGDPLRKNLTAEGTYWEDYQPHEPTLERLKRPF